MQGGLICSFLVVSLSIFLTANALADLSHAPAFDVNARTQVYIVFTDKPPQGLNRETYDIKLLSVVLGSEKAAKEAVLYHYHIMSGFSAKLTPDQASRLKEQPGVLSVTRDGKYKPPIDL